MGWRPPERKTLMLPAANSQLGTPALSRREGAASLDSSTRAPNNDRRAEYINRASLDPGGFGPAVTERSQELAYSADGELPSSRSLLAPFQAKYAAWESSLTDTRSLTSVKGRLVYPLLQVNYGGWRLPVALYLPPLRGSDARR
jgi:hypothetical protein